MPVRGGQVTKQMFTVFLEMICSLLSVDSGPAITSVTLIEWEDGVTMAEPGDDVTL